MAVPTLVVMAAGIGSRFGGVKQIEPIGPSGEIVIDYAIYDAIKAGFGKVVFIIRREIEADFRQKIGRTIEAQVDTAYVLQELDRLPEGFAVPADRKKPWGTGHAVLCAAEAIAEPFAAINADDYYGPGAFKVLGDYLRTAEDRDGVYDYCMVGYVLENTLTDYGHVARGVCTTTEEGALSGIVERLKIQRFGDAVRYTEDDATWVDIDARSVVSMNMWGFTPSFLGELAARFPDFLKHHAGEPKAEYLLPTIVNALITEGKACVTVLRTDERWSGVTYREDMAQLVAFIGQQVDGGVYPAKLWSGSAHGT